MQNKQSGIAPVAIIIIVVALLAIAGGIYYYQIQNGPIVEQLTPSPQPTTPDETTNWQTYRNEEYGFEFKYPNDWEIYSNQKETVIRTIAMHKTQQIEDGTGQVKEFDEPQAVIKWWLLYDKTYSLESWLNKNCNERFQKGDITNIGQISNKAVQCKSDVICEFGYCYSSYAVAVQRPESLSGGFLFIQLNVGEEFTASEIKRNKQEYFPVFDQILSTFKFY